jgi:hydroxymethylpyrimidine pyrophosphatase-like HAD family hydrolase
MKQKLIFLDIDGTLTPAGTNTPPDSALAAIRAAQKNGHKVFLCTGRNLAMLSPLLKYGFDGMVASAGGYVTCGDKVLYDCPMTDAQFRTAMDKLHEGGVFCTVEAKDASYGDENLNAFLAGAGEGNSEIERWRRALAEDLDIRPMHEYDGRPVYKIVVMCRQDAQLDPRARCSSRILRSVCRMWPHTTAATESSSTGNSTRAAACCASARRWAAARRIRSASATA